MRRSIPPCIFILLMLISSAVNAALAPPKELCQPHKHFFTTYLASPIHNAFAISSEGAYGWSSGKSSAEEAIKAAIASCQKNTDESCKVYAVDNSLYIKK